MVDSGPCCAYQSSSLALLCVTLRLPSSLGSRPLSRSAANWASRSGLTSCGSSVSAIVRLIAADERSLGSAVDM